MGSHPINLTVRFILELLALTAAFMWGWKQSEGWLRFVFAFGLLIFIAAIWGTFAVPNDPSRSGNAPIEVAGIVRLIIELTIFGFATWAFYDLGHFKTSLILGIVVILHYIFSYDRIIWLLSQ